MSEVLAQLEKKGGDVDKSANFLANHTTNRAYRSSGYSGISWTFTKSDLLAEGLTTVRLQATSLSNLKLQYQLDGGGYVYGANPMVLDVSALSCTTVLVQTQLQNDGNYEAKISFE